MKKLVISKNQWYLIKNLTELKKLAIFILPFLKPNFFLLLQGDLGVGKTTLVQMIAKQLAIKEKITSPTFAICQQYQIKNNYYLNHFDFFRLSPRENLDCFQELTFNGLNIIEWPEKNPQFWQNKEYLYLTFQIKLIDKKQARIIRIIRHNFDCSLI